MTRKIKISFDVEFEVLDKDRLLKVADVLDPEPEEGEPDRSDPSDFDRRVRNALMLLCAHHEFGDALLAASGIRAVRFDHDTEWPSERAEGLDFAAFFPVDGDQIITPRTALVLHAALEHLADSAWREIDQPGAEALFSSYPKSTFGQDWEWRRMAARCFDDLMADVASGQTPWPRCTGEEVALWLAIREAKDSLDSDPDGMGEVLAPLPEREDDCDFDELVDVLFQDLDFRVLYDPSLDGAEDPEGEIAKTMGYGDKLLPQRWFDWFDDGEPRDPARGYRDEQP